MYIFADASADRGEGKMDIAHVLEYIANADDDNLTEMIHALMDRQKMLHPDWEGMYVSFPLKYSEECKQIMYGIWAVLQKRWEFEREELG